MNNFTTPRVSVVIPNYNHARFLTRRIETVLQQTFQDFEVILMDDRSTDASRSILSLYANNPKVRIEFNTVNSGSAFKQWNKGVGLARGEYVWIAESDDYADVRFLERLVRVLDSEPETAFVYCRSWRVSADDQLDGFLDVSLPNSERWSSDHLSNGRDDCYEHFIAHCLVPNASAVVFRKTIYKRVGGADETLRMCGDWKVWFAMALTGKMAYLSEPLNYYRFHDQSVYGRDKSRDAEAEETLRIVRWMQTQVAFTDLMQARVGMLLEGRWINPLLNANVPFSRKRVILRSAMAIDPRALRRLFRAIARSWFWYPMLNLTRPIRHALGLSQENLGSSLKK
jgi:glycosyltransferase involved in cell wall biosynthesis